MTEPAAAEAHAVADAAAAAARAIPARGGWRDSARHIAPLAWPVLVGQVSVLAFSTVDTFFVARSSALDLAALAVGASAYVTVFVGFMGLLMALSPIVGQLFGAGRLHDAGQQAHQAVWLALALSVLGSVLLLFPAPFLALARASPEVAERVRGYTTALAFSLPASLLFTVYRAFNNAVSRPKAVMLIQMGALALKVPLTGAFVFGVPALNLPSFGVVGCGLATAVAMWAQVLVGVLVLRKDPFYDRFALLGRGLARPEGKALRQHLRLGLPMGASVLVEVTGFSFMALFISRLGTTPVAGHQIAVNIVTLMFMVPLAMASATSTLVAQAIGAGQPERARRLGWHGLQIGTLLALVLSGVVFLLRDRIVGLYTGDAAVVAAALPLLAYIVLFHTVDAAQTIAAFVLRAYKVVAVPTLIYIGALWGVGLGGGWLLAFDDGSGVVPAALRGAPGYWAASTAGLALAAGALSGLLALVLRRQRQRTRQAAPPAQPVQSAQSADA